MPPASPSALDGAHKPCAHKPCRARRAISLAGRPISLAGRHLRLPTNKQTIAHQPCRAVHQSCTAPHQPMAPHQPTAPHQPCTAWSISLARRPTSLTGASPETAKQTTITIKQTKCHQPVHQPWTAPTSLAVSRRAISLAGLSHQPCRAPP